MDALDLYYHPYPRELSTNLQSYLNGVLKPLVVVGEDNVPDTSFYIAKTGHGEKITHFLKPSYVSIAMITMNNAYTQIFKRTLLPDDECLKEYASKLLPKAVGYSAALLEYFFRGTLDVKHLTIQRDADQNLASVTMKVKNTSKLAEQAESMEAGSISLAYRYVPFGSSFPVYGLAEDIYSGISHNDPINSDFVSISATLPTSIPFNAKDIVFTLVYRGKLGNEDDAIAARVLPLTSRIAYSKSAQCGDASYIYTARPDGTDEALVADSSDVAYGYQWRALPTWSMDGKMIAFNGITAANRYEIVVVDLTSDQPYPYNIKRIFGDANCNFAEPSFSPDGSKIVAHRELLQPYLNTNDVADSLVILDVNDGSWTFLPTMQNWTWTQTPIPELPKWSPKGDSIAFAQWSWWDWIYAIIADNIWSMDLNFSTFTNLLDEPMDSRWPSWSPDGEKIVFASRRTEGLSHNIWIMDKDGQNPYKVYDCPDECSEPSFSPDGRKIVFHIAGGSLYTINVDGTEFAALGTTGCDGTPQWSPYLYEKPKTP